MTIPAIWLAFAASLLLHIAVLWQWLPRLHLLSPDETRAGETISRLRVRLAPAPGPAPAAQAPAQVPAPVPRAR
ncbi:MAG: hypothetical protein IH606_22360, partial [Burkholderiales bacterium]|nr:hypothetical protein [Burkholderiales bacterium]